MRFLLMRLLPILVARQGGGGLLQALLMFGLRRNPIGLIGMLLLRRALAGNGRVFGMEVASRRQKRLGWLAGLLGRHQRQPASAASIMARLVRPPR